MNFVGGDQFSLTKDICDIERRFCRFYLTTIKNYLDLDENFVWTATGLLNRSDDDYMIFDDHAGHNKNDAVTSEAHELLMLCIHDTCLGLRKFYTSIMKHEEIPNYLSKKNPLVIYCVAAKSFLAALGICTVIDEAFGKYCLPNKRNTKEIQLIVTEKYPNWKILCSYIKKRIKSCYKHVKINLYFINEPPDCLSAPVFLTLKEADILVMSRYLSQFRHLSIRTHFLEVILNRMKELSILFYMDECQEKYQHTVRHLFAKTDSLIEMRSKKTTFRSLQNLRNEHYFLKFPFLFNTSFGKVSYSICIKFPGISYNKSENKDTSDDIALLRHNKKQMKREISERYAKANLLLSELTTSSEVNSFVNEIKAGLFKRSSIAGKSAQKN